MSLPTGNKWFLLIVLLIAIQGGVLFFLGQPPICECDYIKIWEENIRSSGMSQHLFDWYTFSHIIHGFLFYLLLWWLFPKTPALLRLAFAVGIEAAWEIAENTPWVIEAYRKQALAQGYVGDSIINSIFDTLAMTFGFIMARKIPVWPIISIAIVFELFTLYFIHDNLFLNVLGFVHQFDFINHWQAGV
jgi:hypothetical protein